MKLMKFGVLGAAGLLVLAGAVPAGAQDKGTLKIGIALPLSGGEVANGEPTRNGAMLAIKQANDAGGVQGYTLADNTQDDAVNGVHSPDQGALNMGTLIADPEVIGVVGPFNSSVARAEIPVSNEGGLAQCSPSNTGVDLTKEGSEKYRPANPDVRNYFRVATPDDVQGPAAAQYAFNDLGKKSAFVVDDTEAFGVGVSNSFTAEFEKLGGKVIGRQGNDYTQNQDFSSMLNAVAGQFDVVFFGGTQVTGGGQMRKQMGQAGLLDIPFVGPDGTTDLQPGGSEGGFITLAGVENSANVHGTVAGIHDIPDPEAFRTAYSAEFGKDPGAYSALAYACTQILIQSLDAAITAGTDAAGLREAVRANVFGGQEFGTVLGTLSIDANGDSSQKFISFYATDVTLNDGAGGWVFVKQQDFATAP
jgi:branched-chain amino acid transport system substrate-binding protein